MFKTGVTCESNQYALLDFLPVQYRIMETVYSQFLDSFTVTCSLSTASIIQTFPGRLLRNDDQTTRKRNKTTTTWEQNKWCFLSMKELHRGGRRLVSEVKITAAQFMLVVSVVCYGDMARRNSLCRKWRQKVWPDS